MNEASRSVAIVTGASRGIGAASVRVLAENGMDVVLAVRDPASAAPVADAVKLESGRSLIVPCDVADGNAVAAMVSQAIQTFGRVDVLVNNAGSLGPIASIEQADEDAWLKNIEINLVGAYRCARAVLPHMLARGGGTIINLSTKAAHKPFEGWSAYCSAKAGLAMLTQSLALEYGERGIRTFGFAPGTTDTDMQGQIRASGVNPVSKIRKSDLVPVEDPARGIAYLCSAEADDLAGHELDLNDRELRRRIGIRLL